MSRLQLVQNTAREQRIASNCNISRVRFRTARSLATLLAIVFQRFPATSGP
jgi:hypothetical protein